MACCLPAWGKAGCVAAAARFTAFVLRTGAACAKALAGRRPRSRSQGILFGERQDLKAPQNFALNSGSQRGWLGRARRTKAEFEDRDGTEVQNSRRFTVQPGQDFGIRSALDDFAEDVGVEQEHSRSLEVDLTAGDRNTAQSANFLQRAEERIIVRQAFAKLVRSGWRHLAPRTGHETPQRLFDQRTERFSLSAGLLLELAQERFINVQRRLHGATPELRWRAVNGPG